MQEVNEQEARIRRFLLNELEEDERQRIEERFISNEDFRESVSVAENDLIDDYLEGALSADESQRFLTHYLTTPQQRRKLQIAKSLKRYVAAGVAAAPPPPPDGGGPQDGAVRHLQAKRRFLRNPFISLPLAAGLLLVLGLGAMRLIEFNKPQERVTRDDEQELAGLNDPSLRGQRQPGTAALSITLSPVSSRGLGAQTLSPPPGAVYVELLLVLEGEEYQSYQAELQKVGNPERRTIRRLLAESTPAGRAVRIIVPTRLLPRGDYLLRLTGITSAGGFEAVGTYNFHVTGN